jgi:hypothetical protein
MRAQSYYLVLAAAATAVAQLTSSVRLSTIVTSASPASIATDSVASHTPEPDTWDCVTYNMSDYLQPPMPTGRLLDIYYDHSDKMYQECEDKLPKPFTSYPACTSMATASWCAVRIPLHETSPFGGDTGNSCVTTYTLGAVRSFCTNLQVQMTICGLC